MSKVCVCSLSKPLGFRALKLRLRSFKHMKKKIKNQPFAYCWCCFCCNRTVVEQATIACSSCVTSSREVPKSLARPPQRNSTQLNARHATCNHCFRHRTLDTVVHHHCLHPFLIRTASVRHCRLKKWLRLIIASSHVATLDTWRHCTSKVPCPLTLSTAKCSF